MVRWLNSVVEEKGFVIVEYTGDFPIEDQKHWMEFIKDKQEAIRLAREVYKEKSEPAVNYFVTVEEALRCGRSIEPLLPFSIICAITRSGELIGNAAKEFFISMIPEDDY